MKKAQQILNDGYEYAVGIDLERFFDTVNQSYLIELLSHTIKDGRVISLIHKYLYAGVMIDGVYHPTPEGTPQGGPLSPLLSNIVLNELDKELEKRGSNLDKKMTYNDLLHTNSYGNLDNDNVNLYGVATEDPNQTKYYFLDVLLKEEWEWPDRRDTKLLGKRSTTVYGYSQMVDYYKTEYPETPTDTLPQDFRRTLFWNPNVITDSLGNAQIEFYNNAYSRHFHISGSGITASGTPYCLDLDF